MFHTDIGTEYVKMANAAAWGSRWSRELSLNGVEGSWLSDDLKRRMFQEFTEQIDELEAELATAGLRPRHDAVTRRRRIVRRREHKKAGLLYVAALLSIASMPARSRAAARAEAKPIKAAWIYVGPHNDGGWARHARRRPALRAEDAREEGRHDVPENVPEGLQTLR